MQTRFDSIVSDTITHSWDKLKRRLPNPGIHKRLKNIESFSDLISTLHTYSENGYQHDIVECLDDFLMVINKIHAKGYKPRSEELNTLLALNYRGIPLKKFLSYHRDHLQFRQVIEWAEENKSLYSVAASSLPWAATCDDEAPTFESLSAQMQAKYQVIYGHKYQKIEKIDDFCEGLRGTGLLIAQWSQLDLKEPLHDIFDRFKLLAQVLEEETMQYEGLRASYHQAYWYEKAIKAHNEELSQNGVAVRSLKEKLVEVSIPVINALSENSGIKESINETLGLTNEMGEVLGIELPLIETGIQKAYKECVAYSDRIKNLEEVIEQIAKQVSQFRSACVSYLKKQQGQKQLSAEYDINDKTFANIFRGMEHTLAVKSYTQSVKHSRLSNILMLFTMVLLLSGFGLLTYQSLGIAIPILHVGIGIGVASAGLVGVMLLWWHQYRQAATVVPLPEKSTSRDLQDSFLLVHDAHYHGFPKPRMVYNRRGDDQAFRSEAVSL